MSTNYDELQLQLEYNYGYEFWPDRDRLMASLTYNVCEGIDVGYDDDWRRDALITVVATAITRATERELGYATADIDAIIAPGTNRTRERTRNNYVAKIIEAYKKTRVENPLRLSIFRRLTYETLLQLNDTSEGSDEEQQHLGALAYHCLSAIESLDEGTFK